MRPCVPRRGVCGRVVAAAAPRSPSPPSLDPDRTVSKQNLQHASLDLLTSRSLFWFMLSLVVVWNRIDAFADPETDALIQEAMKEGFGDCTILCIAHRCAEGKRWQHG